MQGMERETHDVVVAAMDTDYADAAYPFLDAVCTGLVKGTVTVDIIIDRLVRQSVECDFGSLRK